METTEIRAAEALYATARWLLDMARTREAAEVFRAMALSVPKDERAWLGLGVCHEQLDQDDVAFQMYSTGQVAAAPAARCALAMARLHRRLGQLDEFEETIESALVAAEMSDDDEIITTIEAERTKS